VKRLLRVVLDTNVVVSALVFSGGRLAPLRKAWQSGRMRPLLAEATVRELAAVLAYPKFRLTADEQMELLADYVPFGEVIKPWKRSPRLPVCRDPFDMIFLELAAAGKAQLLVTGDKDLLVLPGSVSFRIVDPMVAVQAQSGDP
jgi:uncharacterized protein